ncbi:sigma-70 family RNA polymerase sigma factor [Pectinatus frisingensis]|uniref:sigma-70 family RNA polymerase sigma factor n=1 Tax=Pectinatus frisingensis TaxID=865 RepID=UPI0018C7D193|nr:sigma-70 family RNA polymerase sigma factor [Pectinatus frisingensis]
MLECQERFDSFCKKVLRNHARNYDRMLRRRRKQECFSEDVCRDKRFQRFFSVAAFQDSYVFHVLGIDVSVEDGFLGAALQELSEERRTIVLLSYFLDMTDSEIGECLHIIRRTVSYRRDSTLKQLKKYLEDRCR